MATADQVRALITSHMDGDDDRFVAISRQIAAKAESNGHNSISKSILKLLERRRLSPLRLDLHGLLEVHEPRVGLGDMVLDDETRARLRWVLKENEGRGRNKLLERGMRPRRKLLLVGPPGCGKTMTASVLARELELPMFSLAIHSLIESHMGETASNLAKVFDQMRKHAGVYLLDEFDAIGTERDWSGKDGAAAGETRRVLNSLLVLLEKDESNSLILAATNHDDMLDGALFRRFDDVIRYPMPTAEMRIELMIRAIRRTDVGVPDDLPAAASVGDGLSQSEVESACLDAAKEAVLNDLTRIPEGALERWLCRRSER